MLLGGSANAIGTYRPCCGYVNGIQTIPPQTHLNTMDLAAPAATDRPPWFRCVDGVERREKLPHCTAVTAGLRDVPGPNHTFL